jgi:hypothetical protein
MVWILFTSFLLSFLCFWIWATICESNLSTSLSAIMCSPTLEHFYWAFETILKYACGQIMNLWCKIFIMLLFIFKNFYIKCIQNQLFKMCMFLRFYKREQDFVDSSIVSFNSLCKIMDRAIQVWMIKMEFDPRVMVHWYNPFWDIGIAKGLRFKFSGVQVKLTLALY